MSPPPAPTIENVDSDGIPPYTQLTIPLGKSPGLIQHTLPGFVFWRSGDDAAHKSLPLRYFDWPMVSEEPYSPAHPRSLSMNCAVDDEAATHIKFTADQRLPSFELAGRGQTLQGLPIPLYHSHVLWSYAVKLSRAQDDKYDISIVGLGSRLNGLFKNEKYPSNDPPGLRAPPITSAGLAILDTTGAEAILVDLKRSGDDFVAVKRFSKEELPVDDSFGVRLCIVVERAYFNLSTIIDLQPKHRPATRAAVEGILRGERPDGWDCAFANTWPGERGDAGSTLFFAHKAPFERISPHLKKGFAQTNTAHFPNISGDALKLAIRIGYNVDVPLPIGPDRDLFKAISPLFKEHYETVLVKQWEIGFCATALALDTRAPSASSVTYLLRLLDFIWNGRYGYFPVGKRVVIGVLADMMHQSAAPTVFDFVQNTLLPCFHESDMNPKYLPDVLGALTKHIRGVAFVSKTGVVMGSA